MDDFKCNVLIIGKTGAGKSSLLNYICEQNIAETGSGKPVTGEGLYEYIGIIKSQKVRIYDSWGIEAGKDEKWKSLLDNELKKHGIQKNPEDWFHSIIYCIQAGGGRVEPIDTAIINQFLTDGYHITIVLTKADQIDESTIADMRNSIMKEIKDVSISKNDSLLNIIPVCSEEKKTRKGQIHPYGKEELQKAILDGWLKTVVERVPKHVINYCCEYIDKWRNNESKFDFSRQKSSIVQQNLIESANKELSTIRNVLIPEKIENAVNSCRKIQLTLVKITYDSADLLISNKLISDKHFMWQNLIPFWTLINQIKLSQNRNKYITAFINDISETMKKEIYSLEPEISKLVEDILFNKKNKD